MSFTPFGYLRNPGHVATSWRDASGGNLRTAPDRLGVEWVYPVGHDPTSRVGLGLETVVDGRPCRARSHFDAIGLTSRYHSCLIFGFDWQSDGVQVEARFFLANAHALCLRLSVENQASEPRDVRIDVYAWVDDHTVALPGDDSRVLTDSAVQPSAGMAPTNAAAPQLPANAAPPEHPTTAGPPLVLTERPSVHVFLGPGGGGGVKGKVAPGSVVRARCVLARGASTDAAVATGSMALGHAEASFEQHLAEDARFYATCPTLIGDWPAHWREGLFHDFETTRLLVQPAGGIFRDVWPSWMAAWPRVVLAEGTLDMLRLAYADPHLAQRCVLSMFRDAQQPNVPCVFRNGEFNMVAADGSRCGTSPAWCLPFLHLELLYLRTLDRDWLRQVYPYACAFVEWWLRHRVDDDGWVVYKCTWESGEDGNPRLDPTGSGDADISRLVRPVELQATIAHAASVLAFFATELGLASDVPRWQGVESTYRARTRQLFDPEAPRYRDQLLSAPAWEDSPPLSSGGEGGQGGGVRSLPPGEVRSPPRALYWGIDPHRYSVQSLTPRLIGEPLAEAEILRYFCPPWTLWPSWTTTLVESAAAGGLFEPIGALAMETVERVYQVTTRRDLDSLSRPMPGCAPEFWPTDWRAYNGSDAYGWGATTANLLIRHLFGFKESRLTDGWSVVLTPALPRPLLHPGRRYGVRHLNYRGLVFDLTYTVLAGGLLEAELDLGDEPRACYVSRGGDPGTHVYASSTASSRHRFSLQPCRAVTLRLE
ncbi:MAG TPA: hypothetical protein VKV73_20600 [Chloroflexota bacterium]|nr:hypothetical protein [Chloroflexota bacterium]